MINFIKKLFERKQISATMNMAFWQGENGYHGVDWGRR